MRDNRKRDFSLIELLVVIAIIAILAGLMLPALNSARLSALAVSCKNNQRQVGLGFSSYVNDFNGYLATSRYASGLSWTQTWPEFLGDNPIFTYVEDGGIYSALKYYNYKTNHCPAQRVRGWARPANAVGNSTWYNRMGFAAPRGDHEHYGWKTDWRRSISTPAFHALNLNRVDKPAYAWGLTDNTNNNAEPAYFIQPSISKILSL